MRKPVVELAAALLIASTLGCSKPVEQSADIREQSAAAFAQGIAAFDRKEFESAGELLSQAMQGVSIDQYSEAAVKRTVCWAAAGKQQEALAELDRLEANAPNLDQVFAARAYLLAKQGKVAESRTALAKAKQLNRSVQEFKD